MSSHETKLKEEVIIKYYNNDVSSYVLINGNYWNISNYESLYSSADDNVKKLLNYLKSLHYRDNFNKSENIIITVQ